MGKNPIKILAGQTVVYGLGTIIPRLLNYLLVPLYVRVFASGEYGQITELYAWIALFLAILIFGMETTFFRYAHKENSNKIFNNVETFILALTGLFLILYIIFYKSFANLIHYQFNSQYVLFIGIIVSLDAITAVPFAVLRKENKAKRFSTIKILNVSFSVLLQVFLLKVIPETSLKTAKFVFGKQSSLLIWVFISNILASFFNLILLSPQFAKLHLGFDKKLILPMIKYAFPILLIGLVGMINEVADKILIKFLVTVPDESTLASMNKTAQDYAISQVGIYGANYKLAVLMSIFIQMFRFASEPFFFSHAKDRNAPSLYAKVMTYFVIFCLLIFLGVMLYIDVLQYFAGRKGSDYLEGVSIVPIVLVANMFYGIVFNLSIWFKLSDNTFCGTVITIIGTIITLICFFVLIPKIGYMGAALAHLGCYSVMMIVSYLWGQKVFPIPYQIGRILIYFVFALGLYYISKLFIDLTLPLKLTFNTLLLLLFVSFAVLRERKNPLKIE